MERQVVLGGVVYLLGAGGDVVAVEIVEQGVAQGEGERGQGLPVGEGGEAVAVVGVRGEGGGVAHLRLVGIEARGVVVGGEKGAKKMGGECGRELMARAQGEHEASRGMARWTGIERTVEGGVETPAAAGREGGGEAQALGADVFHIGGLAGDVELARREVVAEGPGDEGAGGVAEPEVGDDAFGASAAGGVGGAGETEQVGIGQKGGGGCEVTGEAEDEAGLVLGAGGAAKGGGVWGHIAR